MLEQLWLVPAFPLLGAVANLAFGRQLGRTMVSLIAIGSVALSFFVGVNAVTSFVSLSAPHGFQLRLFDWISWGSGNSAVHVADIGLLLDPLSSVMVLVVSGIGMLIHMYSAGYMADEPGYARYFVYLNLFTFAMLVLVLANNFLLMFVGWELVGLCSYLLIGFWFTRPSAAAAGKKAFITNRIGDFGVLIALFLIWVHWGTFDFFGGPGGASTGVFDDPGRVLATQSVAFAIPMLLILGVTGKSAQIPLFVWLPDAMEGPTPVSALIHAATMVTGGVYLVARAHLLYDQSPDALLTLATIGALTAFVAATVAIVQTDIKRVLAYSTVSQLGFMVLALGSGAYAAAVFHLMTHAFFKALMFLGAGSVIHGLHEQQDLRRMGGLRRYMPVTTWTFIVGWLAIIGAPGFSGFFSKDLILARTFARGLIDPVYLGLYALALLTVGITAFYMSRMVFLAFFGDFRGGVDDHGHAVIPHESPMSMLIPLIALAVGSIVAGWIGVPSFLTGGSSPDSPIEVFLAPAVAATGVWEGTLEHLTEIVLTGLSVMVALVGASLAGLLYLSGAVNPLALAMIFSPITRLFEARWYLDDFYRVAIVGNLARIASFLASFDLAVIGGSVTLVVRTVRGAGSVLRASQAGYVRGYAVTMMVGAFLVLAASWAFR
jgi:NADH-quinone oxidoreductase subunit L